MNPKMSFQERSKFGMERLSKQRPLTYEEMKEQADRVKARTASTVKKERPNESKLGYKANSY